MISNIFNFVKKLLPRIERSTVEEDLRMTEKECVNIVMPSWEAAATYFKLNKLTSPQAEEMGTTFYHTYDLRRASRSPNFVLDIARRVSILHENIAVLQSVLEEHIQKDIITTGMTVQSAFVLRAAANMSLLTRYMLALLNYLYTVEANHNDTTLEPGLEISRAEMAYVDKNFERFCKLYSQYTLPSKDFRKLLGEIPKVFVNDASSNAVKGLYGEGIDPFQANGVSGFVGSPIYKVRLVIARWQHSRYESARDKKQQLELRLLYLQMQKDDAVDPSVVKEITSLQNRIEEYDRYLREVETSVEEG